MSQEQEIKKMNIQVWEVERLQPYELNSKIHDQAQIERIAQSISEFGWDQPIVVDASGVIIKGHGRRLAALHLGVKRVPVWVRDDLTPDQVRAARLADNRVALSDIDTKLLQQELATLDFNLEGIFDAKELQFFDHDLSAMNVDVFVDDVDVEVARQSAENVNKIKEMDERPVKIDKALGFSKVRGEDERVLARFMALIQAESGKEPAEAFVDFVRGVLNPEAA